VTHFESDDGAVITAELIGGIHGPITLDEDGILISRITDKVTGLKVTASKGGETVYGVISLTGLTLQGAS